MARTAKTMSFEGMSNAYNPYLDFLSGNQKNLVGTPITPDDAALDAVVAGGATAAEIVATSLVANAVNTTDWTANAEGKVFFDVASGKAVKLVQEQSTGDLKLIPADSSEIDTEGEFMPEPKTNKFKYFNPEQKKKLQELDTEFSDIYSSAAG